MDLLTKSAVRLSLASALCCLATAATAQIPGAATVTYSPGAAPVPTVSGALLIALAGVLAFVALRLLKDKPRLGMLRVAAPIMIAALASGVGGVKLITEAQAAPVDVQMTAAGGGSLSLPTGQSRLVNATTGWLKIDDIQYAEGCSAVAPSAPGPTVCSASTTLAPNSVGACEIEVSCNPCRFAWNPNFYVDFSGGPFVDSGNYWSDAACSVPNGNLSRKWVFSLSGQSNATNICIANLGVGFTAIPSHGPNVFECTL